MATLNIYFTESDPAPTNGYIVRYKKAGDPTYTTVSPNQFTSPIIVTGVNNSFSYEGTIQSDCSNGVYSTPSPFTVDPCVGDNYRVIGEECEQGVRVNLLSVDNGDGTFTCHYRYEFSDTTQTITYYEINSVPCVI